MASRSHLEWHLIVIWLTEVALFASGALLRLGSPLKWMPSQPHLSQVRLGGVEQFIQHYDRCKGVELPLFVWGDEIEYGVFAHNKLGHYDLSMATTRTREYLAKLEKRWMDFPIGCEWQPEYGSWMVEAVPRSPYGSYVSDLLNVEKSMQLRRKRLHFVLTGNEVAPTTSNFPMLGVAGYAHSENSFGLVANSQFLTDQVINPHPRFAALTQNIRLRRGSNVNISIPREDGVGTIHMDAMAFGMGCCCLQVTMQCKSEAESRFLHDQLLVIGPLLQALSASTPIFKGQLAGTDTRWNVISQAVDDRTSAERGEPMAQSLPNPALAGSGVKPLSRSRYSASCLYLHQPEVQEDTRRVLALNDAQVEIDEQVLAMAIRRGIDAPLAMHLAHMFTRDPLVIFDDAIVLDNSRALDHFENIQSTNWRSMRWKPPSLRVGLEFARRRDQQLQQGKEANEDGFVDFDHNILVEDREAFCALVDSLEPSSTSSSSSEQSQEKSEEDLQSYGPGWRVEFRPLEVQLTDFENAAFAVFTVLLSRALVARGHQGNSMVLPMSLVEENMRRAQLKDAVLTQKFFVRRNAFSAATSNKGEGSFHIPARDEIDIAELTMDEIINGESIAAAPDGNGDGHRCHRFPGLVHIALDYMRQLGCDDAPAVSQGLAPYLQLLQHRANGSLPTAARYLRDFVCQHAGYEGRGELTPAIADDLLQHCEDIGMGRMSALSLYGQFKAVGKLDEIDEEDLMFSNFTCFVKPVIAPNGMSLAPELPIHQDVSKKDEEKGDREEQEEKEKQHQKEKSENNGGFVEAVKELLLKPWRRVKRSKEEQIKL